jgi:hypothetical protein
MDMWGYPTPHLNLEVPINGKSQPQRDPHAALDELTVPQP